MQVNIDQSIHDKINKFKFDFNDIGFGKHMMPIMAMAVWENEKWSDINIIPYQNIGMDPCTKVLHYGQEIFEGMKAYRNPNGSVYLFRPNENAKRFNASARRMCMPEISEEAFVEAVVQMTSLSKNHIPQRQGESLYLRPFMIATEVGLGIKPANRFHFLIVASPCGSYFSGDSVKVLIERQDCRAASGGTGAAKTGGNYAGSLNSYKKTMTLGLDQTMWLDAANKTSIEEMSGMNFFAIVDNELHTPLLTDTILNGITRKSILDLAKSQGITVMEKRMDVNDFIEDVKSGKCSEAFVCGTAAIIAPIASFHEEKGTVYSLKNPEAPIAMKLRDKLLNIQSGRDTINNDWVLELK